MNMPSLHSYLHYGYFPEDSEDSRRFREDLFKNLADSEPTQGQRSFEGLVETGASILREILARWIREAGSTRRHILPLSGGLDSRALFAALLEHAGPDRITTVTFGTSGTFDYEIGIALARHAGVNYRVIDLTSDSWGWDATEILELARGQVEPTCLFESYVNSAVMREFGDERLYWSGFMGDPLAGSHLPVRESAEWDEARQNFVRRNRFSRSVLITPPGYAPESELPRRPFLPRERLSFDEQIDFSVRQGKLIRNLVLPSKEAYRTPFLDPAWVRFLLNAPQHFRRGEILYRAILVRAYPELFSLPTKNHFGLPLTASKAAVVFRKAVFTGKQVLWNRAPFFRNPRWKWINYVDFSEALRTRKDLRSVVGDSLRDLKIRGVVDWIDIDALWKKHQEGRENHAFALMGLASAEIYLKVGRIQHW